MIDAIAQYEVEGVATTLPFGRFVCRHEAFRSGNFDTNFIKLHYTKEELQQETQSEAQVAAALAASVYNDFLGKIAVPQVTPSGWLDRKL